MPNGFPHVYVAAGTLASGASTITSIDLGQAGWRSTMLEIPSLSTNAALTLFVSSDGSSFKQLFEQVNTAPVQFQQVVLASTVANCVIPLTIGARYLQVRATGTVDDGATFKVICT